MKTISIEFCLITFLLLLIFLINILHILYLIIYKHNKQIKSIRLILINSSISSLIVSIWLIPFFYFRSLWLSESFPWRLWSFIFHIVDAVQLYSLLLLITTRSFQRIFICFTWLAPIIAYSPLLWLTSTYHQIDYLPYRRLTIDIPWWILPIIYFSMYLLPIIISFILINIHICWPLIYYYYKKYRNNIYKKSINEHHKDMTELTDLIETVFNFQLEQSTNTSNPLNVNTWISSFSNETSKDINRSLSYKVCQDETFFLFDELSISPLIHSSSIQTKDNIEQQPLNSSLLLIIICLLLLVHLPYTLLALFDITSLQLSIFIYIHWFGTLFIPIIHIK